MLADRIARMDKMSARAAAVAPDLEAAVLEGTAGPAVAHRALAVPVPAVHVAMVAVPVPAVHDAMVAGSGTVRVAEMAQVAGPMGRVALRAPVTGSSATTNP
jgi:hypothetical protein